MVSVRQAHLTRRSRNLFASGEISLVTGGPAVASVTAKTKCWLLAVSTQQFDVLTKNFPELKVMVEKLADQRRRDNTRILAGDPNYVSQELQLVYCSETSSTPQ